MTFQLIGAEELGRRLESLSRAAARRVLPKAVRAAVAPPLKAARSLAPRRSGTLQKSLALVIRRYDGAVVGIVGQDRNNTASKSKAAARRRSRAGGLSRAGKAPPVHLVDQPVRPHVIAPRGRWLKLTYAGRTVFARSASHPGHRGAGFVRRAAEQTQAASLQAFANKASEEIDREAAKGGGS